MTMKILITGAFGNLGALAIEEALQQGHAVCAFDLDTKRNRKVAQRYAEKVSVVWGDICDRASVARAVEGQDAVIHTAALLPPISEKFPERAKAVNVEGTKQLLDVLRAQTAPPTIVYPSSVTVYAPEVAQSQIVNAQTPTQGTDVYSSTKVECEALIKASTLPYVILRVGVAIDEQLQKVEPIVMRLLFEVRPDNRMEVVYSRDVALALVNATHTRAALGKVLLIGGGQQCQVTQADLFRLLLDALYIRNFPYSRAFGKADYYTAWMDTTESQALLQYQRRTPQYIGEIMAKRFRLLAPLLILVSPAIKRYLLHFSGPYHGRPPRPSWKALLEAEKK